MDTTTITTWTACIIGMILLPFAFQSSFWFLCRCIFTLDECVRHRNWNRRVTEEDIKEFRKMLDKTKQSEDY